MLINKNKIKQKSNVSAALWIPLIWMMYSAAKPISLWFGISPEKPKYVEYMEGNPVDRYILSVLIILNIYVLLKRKIAWRSVFKHNLFITIWVLYCGISLLWADFPIVSFKRWIKEIGMILSIIIVLTEVEPVGAVKILIKRFSYILVTTSIMLIVFFPKIGIRGSFGSGLNYIGVSWDKNGLGNICLVSGFFLFCNLFSMRRTDKLGTDDKLFMNKEKSSIQYIFLFVTFYILCILNSATSLGGFLIGVVLYLALGTNVIKRNIKNIWMFVIIAIFTGIIIQLSFDIIGMFVKFMGRDLTLTGRTLIWKKLLAFRTNPLIGVGYGSFWLGKRLDSLMKLHQGINTSHNGYLNVYLELGQIGLFLLAGVIYNSYKNINRVLLTNFDYGRFRIAMFVIVLLYNVTEDGFAKMSLMWFVLLLISIDIPLRSKLNSSGYVATLARFSPSEK